MAATLVAGLAVAALVTWRVARRVTRWQRRRAEIARDRAMQRSADLVQVDVISGRRFEDFLALLFEELGYRVEMTRFVGDYGGDLVLVREGLRIVVQAKRYHARGPARGSPHLASVGPASGSDRPPPASLWPG